MKRKPVKRPKRKPAAKPQSTAVHAALAEMVRQAEAAGQRDLPHVVHAREALST